MSREIVFKDDRYGVFRNKKIAEINEHGYLFLFQDLTTEDGGTRVNSFLLDREELEQLVQFLTVKE